MTFIVRIRSSRGELALAGPRGQIDDVLNLTDDEEDESTETNGVITSSSNRRKRPKTQVSPIN